jgi:hypothetical protein
MVRHRRKLAGVLPLLPRLVLEGRVAVHEFRLAGKQKLLQIPDFLWANREASEVA